MTESQRELIYAMHRRGKLFDEIAVELDMKPERVLHDLARILNERAGWFGLGDPRNTFQAIPGSPGMRLRHGCRTWIAPPICGSPAF